MHCARQCERFRPVIATAGSAVKTSCTAAEHESALPQSRTPAALCTGGRARQHPQGYIAKEREREKRTPSTPATVISLGPRCSDPARAKAEHFGCAVARATVGGVVGVMLPLLYGPGSHVYQSARAARAL